MNSRFEQAYLLYRIWLAYQCHPNHEALDKLEPFDALQELLADQYFNDDVHAVARGGVIIATPQSMRDTIFRGDLQLRHFIRSVRAEGEAGARQFIIKSHAESRGILSRFRAGKNSGLVAAYQLRLNPQNALQITFTSRSFADVLELLDEIKASRDVSAGPLMVQLIQIADRESEKEDEKEEEDDLLKQVSDPKYWSSRRLPDLIAFLSDAQSHGISIARGAASKAPSNQASVNIFLGDPDEIPDNASKPIHVVVPPAYQFRTDLKIDGCVKKIHQVNNDDHFFYDVLIDPTHSTDADIDLMRGRLEETTRYGATSYSKLTDKILMAHFNDGLTLKEMARIAVGAHFLQNDRSNFTVLGIRDLDGDLIAASDNGESPVNDTPRVIRLHTGDILIPAFFRTDASDISIVTGPDFETSQTQTSMYASHNVMVIRVETNKPNQWHPLALWLQLRHGFLAELINQVANDSRISVRIMRELPVGNPPPDQEQQVQRYIACRRELDRAKGNMESFLKELGSRNRDTLA